MKTIMLTGWNYTSENIKKAESVIAANSFCVKIEEEFENRIAYAVGEESEIKKFFAECRKK